MASMWILRPRPNSRLTAVRYSVSVIPNCGIMQSGIGLSDGRELSCPSRFVVRVSSRIFTAVVIDKAVAERMTQKIDMEWVIVRPARSISLP